MREQAFGMHVAEILDREGRLAIVLGGARRQHARAEAARLVDQRGFLVAEPEGVGGEDRRVGLCVSMAFMRRTYQGFAASAAFRKLKIAASNACGASRFGMWPRPGRQT